MTTSGSSFLHRSLPGVFIFIWASGFVAAKYGLPYAEPLTFLSMRYLGVVILMLTLALIMRAPWPARKEWLPIAIAGVLMQAVYLGGIWCAVKLGMPAGMAALIANTQPILTAIMGPIIGERIRGRQWLGLAFGIAGVGLVVANKISVVHLSVASVALAIMALLAMTSGTIYQKKTCPSFDVRTGQVIQFGASLLVTIPLALLLETQTILWTSHFFIAMAWSIFILSGVGISVLYVLIRHGEATKVTSYMYLVPAVTALMAWLMFGEKFTLTAVVGMVIALMGVALVVRPAR
ncbi:EamA family transporter [Undibacterium jejuense]|uniref:EamA family transporter n=1 Tax=Undibacterium jejuense TaxID=1344949 RepID=A0A923KIP8_9BURK|nr:EamA family transporter [Undibacterium jejuense]MBC3862992.1 EamA family transporter [Undibacterium jejuense]